VSRARQFLGITASNRFVAPNPNDIVACRPIAGQQLSYKQIHKSCCWVTASQTNMFPWKWLNYNNEEHCFPCSPCLDVITRIVSWESTVGAVSQLCDIHQPVRTSAEDIVRIHYQETTNENKHRLQWSLECVNQWGCYNYL
jgi:hypothetical protein